MPKVQEEQLPQKPTGSVRLHLLDLRCLGFLYQRTVTETSRSFPLKAPFICLKIEKHIMYDSFSGPKMASDIDNMTYCSGLKSHKNVPVPLVVLTIRILFRVATKSEGCLQVLSHLMHMVALFF
jgi:hypothetical protein